MWVLTRRLDAAAAERERLLLAAVQASENERRRIARDLHDGVVQDLAGISFAASATARDVADRPEVAKRLEALGAGVRSSLRALRSLLVEIYPPDLRTEGLGAALDDLLAPATASGVRVTLEVADTDGVREETVALVWRVAQEAVRNALRHGRPSTLDVRVERDATGVRLVVADDGTGFDVEGESRDGHLGLRASARSGQGGRRHPRRTLSQGSRHHRRTRGEAMSESETIKVVLVDDHAMVRLGLEQLLGAAEGIEVVGSAGDGREALKIVQMTGPDVVLMDLQMPDVDGVTATRRIVAADSDVQVVVLTSFSDSERIVAALDAGAIGYLLKDAEPDDLLEGVRAAARGESPLHPRAARQLLTARSAQRGGQVDLTPREAEVLGLVRQGLANKQIARRLGISERTVKAHLTSTFQRIGVADRTQAALWAERHGVS